MVLGIGALASLGLALPTGMAFGYGYGYGVRAGYSAFKKPSDEVQKLKLSANPVTGALGAGLQSAEERTGQQIKSIPELQTQPTVKTQSEELESATGSDSYRDVRYNNTYAMRVSKIISIGKKHGMDQKEAMNAFYANQPPFAKRARGYRH